MRKRDGKNNLVAKKITNSLGHHTTVWVKIDGDPKRIKQSKTTKLMRSHNSIVGKLNKDIKEGGEKEGLASVVRIMMHTGIRIGNEKSADGYKSLRDKKIKQTFGLSTIKKEHVHFDKNGVTLKFQGKRDVTQEIRIDDSQVVAMVKMLYDEAGDGEIVPYTPYEVAKYIKSTIGNEFTPKDLRMVRANREAIKQMVKLYKKPKVKTISEVNAEINEICDHVSDVLGNTRGVAKRSYINEYLLTDFKYKRLIPKKRRKKK